MTTNEIRNKRAKNNGASQSPRHGRSQLADRVKLDSSKRNTAYQHHFLHWCGQPSLGRSVIPSSDCDVTHHQPQRKETRKHFSFHPSPAGSPRHPTHPRITLTSTSLAMAFCVELVLGCDLRMHSVTDKRDKRSRLPKRSYQIVICLQLLMSLLLLLVLLGCLLLLT